MTLFNSDGRRCKDWDGKCPSGFGLVTSKRMRCDVVPGTGNYCPDKCCKREGIPPDNYKNGVFLASYRII